MASKEDEKQCSNESLNANSEESDNVQINKGSGICDESSQLTKGKKRSLSSDEASDPTSDEFEGSPPSLNDDSSQETSEKSERIASDSSESNMEIVISEPTLITHQIDTANSKKIELNIGKRDESDESMTASDGASTDLSKYRMDEAIYIASTSGSAKQIVKDLSEYEMISPNPSSVNSEEYEKVSFKCGKCSPNASFESQEKLDSHDEEVHGMDSSIVIT